LIKENKLIFKEENIINLQQMQDMEKKIKRGKYLNTTEDKEV
jgi:hypothetical protein